MKTLRPLIAVAGLLVTGSAYAHPGHDVASFVGGLSHPFSGLDHLLAMLAVGLYAARQQGAARWALPLGFVVTMLAGALLAQVGLAMPVIEAGIGISVVVLGLLVATLIRLPLAAGLPLVGAFALCHGAAHYAERGSAGLLTYTAGFVLATAALHGLGYLLARATPQTARGIKLQRTLGGLIATTGLVILGS